MKHLDPEFYQYLSKLHHFIKEQNKMIMKLSSEINDIQHDIKQLKSNPTKIEYKFDQLKVEQLSGTLNIGLSPKLNDTLEDISIDGIENGNINVNNNEYQEIKKEIQQKLEDFLDGEGFEFIEATVKEHHQPLQDSYKKVIINDIKGQLAKKIDSYFNQLDPNSTVSQVEIGKIIERIKEDIKNAIKTFMMNFPGKE